MDSRYLQNNEELKRPQQEIDEDRRSFLTAGRPVPRMRSRSRRPPR